MSTTASTSTRESFSRVSLGYVVAVLFWLLVGPLQAGEVHSHDKFCGPGSLCQFPAGDLTNSSVNKKWSAEELLATRWRDVSERTPLNLSYTLTRHDGETVRLDEFKGAPFILSFAYTRCLNSNKCQAVTARMGELQRRLSDAGLLTATKLVLVTYDPQYDSEQTLVTYARENNLVLGKEAFFLRPEMSSARQLFADLGVTISFYTSQVNMHEIRLLLIDREGRLARTYKTVIWNNSDVVNDLKRLVEEGEETAAIAKP